MNTERPYQEFKVVVDGLNLSADLTERINLAIQRAVLHEVANFDRPGNLALSLPTTKIGGNGGTKGMLVRLEMPEV